MTKDVIAYLNFANALKNFVEVSRLPSGFSRPDL